MRGRRGQQLGEYAVLIGIVATAFLSMQMYISRRVGGRLVSLSEEIFGPPPPKQPGASSSESSSSTTRSTVNASGSAGSVHTQFTSDTEGNSSSGFILARAYGPYLGVVFRNPTSAAMIASQLCGGDCAVKQVTTNKKGVVTATIVEKGKTRRFSFKVIGAVKWYQGGAFLAASLDTNLNGRRLDGRPDRLVFGVPAELSKFVRGSAKGKGPLEFPLETFETAAQRNQKSKRGPINLKDGKALDITTDDTKVFNEFLSPDGLPELVRVEKNIGTRKFQAIDWYVVDMDDAKSVMKALAKQPSVKVTTRRSDMPMVDEAFAAGKTAPFEGMTYYVRFTPKVTRPPASLGLDPFYQKYVSVGGVPIVSSGNVPDEALWAAAETIKRMLAGRPDLLAELIKAGVRVVVVGKGEKTTDIPEFRDLAKQYPEVHWDRFRGLGATPEHPVVMTSEENLLGYRNDPHRTDNVLVMELTHAIHLVALNRIDPSFDRRLRAAFERAMAKGLWKNTYAATDYMEYWGVGVQAWFNGLGESARPDGIFNHVNTREELKRYDPELAALIGKVFRDSYIPLFEPKGKTKRLTPSRSGARPGGPPVVQDPRSGRRDVGHIEP